MPPILATKESRLRFLDLDPLLAELRQEGTAFIPEAVRVMRTATGNFLDEPFIESVHFANFGCPEMFDDGISSFAGNTSRATVNFEASCCILEPMPTATHILEAFPGRSTRPSPTARWRRPRTRSRCSTPTSGARG